MTQRQDTELDNQINSITKDFATRLDAMATMPALRAGLLNAALSDLIWTIYHDMPDLRYDLAEALEGMPAAIKDAINEDGRKQGTD